MPGRIPGGASDCLRPTPKFKEGRPCRGHGTGLPGLDVLERRELLTRKCPREHARHRAGDRCQSRPIADVSVPVTAYNINGRIPIVLGTATSPTTGSTLLPQVVAAIGPNGKRLANPAGGTLQRPVP